MQAIPTTSSGERGTHSSEWEVTQMLRRERHAQRWPSRWGEQCWLYQQRALGSGKLIPQNEGTFFLGLIFMIHNLQKLVHMQSRALAAESDDVRKIASPQSSSSLSFSADTRENVPNRGKQTAAPLSLKRGTGRERSFYIEKAHSARRFPLKDIACVLLAQTKDAKIVCVIGFQIARTRIHTQS